MVFAAIGEVFPHKLDEHFTNIFFHILAIWWIEPCNLPASISSSVLSIAICYYCKILMKNVHNPLVLVRRRI